MKLLLLISLLFSLALSKNAYVSYHLYNAGFPLASCACSDGKNGLITRWSLKNLSSMYPYVTAYSGAAWNSPNCGKCIKITGPKKTVFLTVIDMCGPAPPSYDAHFDVSREAFAEIFGSTTAGTAGAKWEWASYSKFCRGNRG